MRNLSAVFFVALTLCMSHIGNAATETVQSLPPTVECVEFSNASVQTTPVELYRLVTVCAAQGQYSSAIDYFALAGVFSRFDTYRVSDTSAHQIARILKSAALDGIPSANKANFQRLAGEAFDDKEKHEMLCAHVRKVGHPSYQPNYMANHGMDAMISVAGGKAKQELARPFDADVSWTKALASYLNCQ